MTVAWWLPMPKRCSGFGVDLRGLHETWGGLMAETQDIETPGDDQLEMAWVVIANASDWDLGGKQPAEWREAAERWRDAYFALLSNGED